MLIIMLANVIKTPVQHNYVPNFLAINYLQISVVLLLLLVKLCTRSNSLSKFNKYDMLHYKLTYNS